MTSSQTFGQAIKQPVHLTSASLTANQRPLATPWVVPCIPRIGVCFDRKKPGQQPVRHSGGQVTKLRCHVRFKRSDPPGRSSWWLLLALNGCQRFNQPEPWRRVTGSQCIHQWLLAQDSADLPLQFGERRMRPACTLCRLTAASAHILPRDTVQCGWRCVQRGTGTEEKQHAKQAKPLADYPTKILHKKFIGFKTHDQNPG